jgi:GNAT superfamily N-acetyltransferase
VNAWRGNPESASEATSALFAHLTRAHTLGPVPDEPAQDSLWLDYDLASLAENRLGEVVDAERISAAQREDLVQRAAEGRPPPAPRRDLLAPFWIVRRGQRVGTVAVAVPAYGTRTVELASLFIRPEARGQGLAGTVLRTVYDAAVRAGLGGLRLETNWCWQPAVRLYVANRMWVYGWKHELVFVWWPEIPSWRLDLEGDQARLMTIDRDTGRSRLLIEARREGQTLHWQVVDDAAALARSDAAFLAPGTLAVALAVRGWPLIGSADEWSAQRRRGGSDLGGPAELAWKIRVWEALARHSGWQANTPRIPGLDYPSWAGLEREWAEPPDWPPPARART